MQRSLFKKALPHIAAVLTFLVLSCIYFAPQIEGKVVSQPDIRSYEAFSHETREVKEETGHSPLWTNSIFSGMPAYQISAPTRGNLIQYFKEVIQLFIHRPIGYFVAAGICYYILLIALGAGPWLGILGAIGFSYTTNNLLLFVTGHNSKLDTLIYLAPVIAGMILSFRKRYLLGGVLYSIPLAIAIYNGHYQMVYYLFLLLGIYGLIELYRAFRAKTLPAFGKAAGILLLATVLAAGASSSRLLSTAEYSRDTMRGAPILEDNQHSQASSSETEGLSWEYAMRWSNGLKDVVAILVPRAAGGGSQEIVNEKSNVYKDFRQRGINVPSKLHLPLYHGAQPFTSGAIYFGALFLFLFVLGAFWLKGHLKWWLVGAFIFSILISMGNEFALLNKPLFDYFPVFNKFRAPSSMLGVTALLVPLLGVLGLRNLFNDKLSEQEIKKGLYFAAGITGGLCLFIALLGPSMTTFTNPADQNYIQAGFNQEALIADRKMYMRLDAIRSLVIILITAAILLAYTRKWFNSLVTLLLLGALALFDLWGIGKRYLSEDDFLTRQKADQYFQLTEADRKILQDDDLHYRVHDLTGDPWNDAYRSYWHHLIGGYHAAKLQRYQDIIDYYLSKGSQNVLNMLNAKYFLYKAEDDKIRVQPNYSALGNAWFVEGIRIVDSAEEEINAIENLDPAADAIVHKEFSDLVEGFDPVKSGEINLVSYHPEHLVYEANARGDQLAVFSEVWYGPDKGWEAYIDGQPAELFRANYILRALNVPSGEHTIELKFHPKSYYLGATVGYTSSVLLLLFLVGAGYRVVKKGGFDLKQTGSEEKAPGQKPQRKKGPASRTRKQRNRR